MSVAKRFLSFLNKFIPKKNIILFNSYPAYSDNSLALYKYIFDCRKDLTQKYELLWGQESKDKIPSYLDKYKIKAVDKKTVKGIITFLRAKYVFSTHGYFPDLNSGNGQIQVNLWHGCGYKAIVDDEKCFLGDFTVAISDTYRKIQAENLGNKTQDVLVTGYPRNDVFFKNNSTLGKLNLSNKYELIIAWLPTYRKASIGHQGIDGNINTFGLSALDPSTLCSINMVLKSKNMLLIIKPHPMESVKIINDLKLSNIIVINSSELQEKGIELYSLLSETDVLLSDYSSVVIDYLLLNKPIAMVLSDLEEYKTSRGFVFDPVMDYFPGPIISDKNSLLNYLTNIKIINSEWEAKRMKIKKSLHKYFDGNSSERVCEVFFGKKD